MFHYRLNGSGNGIKELDYFADSFNIPLLTPVTIAGPDGQDSEGDADIDNNGDIQNWGYHAPQFTFDVNGNVTGSSAAPEPSAQAP